MSNESVKAEGTLNQNLTSNKAVGTDTLEYMLKAFEQLPQKYKVAFFSVSLIGIISLGAYSIYSGYSIIRNQDGWSFNAPSIS